MLDYILTDLIGLIRIVLLDITLAADNAIAIGLAVNGLPEHQKKKAIFWGLGAAAFIRIFLAIIVQYLLKIPGLNIIGGGLLLWVCWEMYCSIKDNHKETTTNQTSPKNNTLKKSITSIIIADISMSLDNVLGVAGAAGNNLWLMTGGILLSVLLMGMAATYIAKLLHRYKWLAWIGLLIILSVAIELIYKGSMQIYLHFIILTP